MTETLNWISLTKLDDSPFQPRVTYTNLDEMADSIAANGVLQPIIVRKKGGRYEIVAGHRRKRGAERAGLKTVPAIVRQMSDSEARQAILVENGQRQDLGPLEELEVYLGLRNEGMGIAEIARAVGKFEGHVYRRMHLETLVNEGREALQAGHLPVAVAEMIARLSETNQVRAVETLSGGPERRAATVGIAKEWIARNATLLIAEAPFDPEDPSLGADGMGKCSECPHNSAGTMLFPDLETAQCFHRPCWDHKFEVSWERRAEAAAESGIVVMEGEDALTALDVYGHLRSGWMDLDQKVYGSDGKSKTLRAQLGKKRLEEITVHLVRDRGRVFELVRTRDVKKKVAADPKPSDPVHLSNSGPADDAAAQRAKVYKTFRRNVFDTMRNSLDKQEMEGSEDLWTKLALGTIARSPSSALSAAAKTRKLASKEEEGMPITWLNEWVIGKRDGLAGDERRRCSLSDMQLLVIELLIGPDMGPHWETGFSESSVFLTALFDGEKGVDALRIAWERAKTEVAEKAAKKNAEPAPEPAPEPETEEDETAKIVRLYKEGKSSSQIGTELGLSKDAVRRRLKKAMG